MESEKAQRKALQESVLARAKTVGIKADGTDEDNRKLDRLLNSWSGKLQTRRDAAVNGFQDFAERAAKSKARETDVLEGAQKAIRSGLVLAFPDYDEDRINAKYQQVLARVQESFDPLMSDPLLIADVKRAGAVKVVLSDVILKESVMNRLMTLFLAKPAIWREELLVAAALDLAGREPAEADPRMRWRLDGSTLEALETMFEDGQGLRTIEEKIGSRAWRTVVMKKAIAESFSDADIPGDEFSADQQELIADKTLEHFALRRAFDNIKRSSQLGRGYETPRCTDIAAGAQRVGSSASSQSLTFSGPNPNTGLARPRM